MWQIGIYHTQKDSKGQLCKGLAFYLFNVGEAVSKPLKSVKLEFDTPKKIFVCKIHFIAEDV